MSNLVSQGGMFSSILGGGSKSDGAGGSGSSKKVESDKPKATDISHLIKRKKPDTPVDEPTAAADGPSPAKKPTL